jgi:hypothetical protein
MRWTDFLVLALCACGPRPIPPGSPDQSLPDAMRLVCDTPSRASRDRNQGNHSDKIAGHLTDGIGNARVLQAVETWKTDGIDKKQLAALIAEAKLPACPLMKETGS